MYKKPYIAKQPVRFTRVYQVGRKPKSSATTIPKDIVKAFNIQPRDQLGWLVVGTGKNSHISVVVMSDVKDITLVSAEWEYKDTKKKTRKVSKTSP